MPEENIEIYTKKQPTFYDEGMEESDDEDRFKKLRSYRSLPRVPVPAIQYIIIISFTNIQIQVLMFVQIFQVFKRNK